MNDKREIQRDNIFKAKEKIKSISESLNKKFNTIERFESKLFLALKLMYSFGFTTPDLLKEFLQINSFGFAKKLELRGLVTRKNMNIKIIAKNYPHSLLTLTKFGFETYKNMLIEKFNFKADYINEMKYNINLEKFIERLMDYVIIQKIFISNYNYVLKSTSNELNYDTYRTFKIKNPEFIITPDLIFYFQDEIQIIEFKRTVQDRKKTEKLLNDYFEILENDSNKIKIYIYCMNENLKNYFIEILNSRSYAGLNEYSNPFVQFIKYYFNKEINKIAKTESKAYNINNKKRINFTTINTINGIQAIEKHKWYYASKFVY